MLHYRSLAVGTKNGYKLYELKKIDKLDVLYEDSEYYFKFLIKFLRNIFLDSDYTCIVERLFSSSLLAVVSLSSPRKLKVCHFKKNTEIIQNSYQNTILAVKLNRQRLVVCLEESIFIHNISDLKLIHSIKHIPRNPSGLIALAPSSDQCFLAYPAKNTTGEVNIFDALKLENKLTIAAHDNPLVSMTFDSQGIKLATASERVCLSCLIYFIKSIIIISFRELLLEFLILSKAFAFMNFVVVMLGVFQYIHYRLAPILCFYVLQAIRKLFISLNLLKSK